MSRSGILGGLCAAVLACAPLAWAQYPGHVNPNASPAGEHLRATAVLEYTGTLDHITASRLVPLAVWDGLEYEPGALYLAAPAPLAVLSGTQYELESNGKSQGFYNVGHAEQIADVWVGVGNYQSPEVEAKLRPMKHLPQIIGGKYSNDPSKPHFAHVPPGDVQGDAAEQSAGTPTLQKGSGKSETAGKSAGSSNTGPTLHRRAEAAEDDNASQQSANSLPIDPDRPRLSYANPNAKKKGPAALFGMPADMKQVAAVSDSQKLDDESYAFIWSNPTDEAKMQLALEAMAQQALSPAASATAAKKKTRGGKTAAAPAPPTLEKVQFRAFNLTFSGGATMVLSARSSTSPVQYVTIVAQPDFYGNPQVLLKQVTNGNQLDAVPQMRLVDAVDTTGNGRGDLIFELRGYSYRQFAIYSIYGGVAKRVFITQPISTPQAVVDPNSLS